MSIILKKKIRPIRLIADNSASVFVSNNRTIEIIITKRAFSWKKGPLLWHIATHFRLPEILEILPEIISKLREFGDIEKGIKRNSISIFRNQSIYP